MTINQNSRYDEALLNDTLRKNLCAKINFDSDLHKLDLSDLRRMQKRKVNHKQQTALNKQEEYLLELKKSGNDAEFKQYFRVNKSNIVGIPLKSDYVQWCDKGEESSIAEYMRIERNCTYISIDYRSLLNGLALELCYADIIGDFEEINEALKNLNPVKSYSSDILRDLDWLCEYEEARDFRIGKSEYYSHKDKCMDYFLNKVDYCITYKNMIDSTAKYMLCLILNSIAKECEYMKIPLQLVGVREAGLEFILYTKEESVYNCVLRLLRESAVARIMGRKFCFYPTLFVINIV